METDEAKALWLERYFLGVGLFGFTVWILLFFVLTLAFTAAGVLLSIWCIYGLFRALVQLVRSDFSTGWSLLFQSVGLCLIVLVPLILWYGFGVALQDGVQRHGLMLD